VRRRACEADLRRDARGSTRGCIYQSLVREAAGGAVSVSYRVRYVVDVSCVSDTPALMLIR